MELYTMTTTLLYIVIRDGLHKKSSTLQQTWLVGSREEGALDVSSTLIGCNFRAPTFHDLATGFAPLVPRNRPDNSIT